MDKAGSVLLDAPRAVMVLSGWCLVTLALDKIGFTPLYALPVVTINKPFETMAPTS